MNNTTPSIRPAALLVLSILLGPTVASADDGVIEINQTCAVNTGCLAGDPPGFPVAIGTAGAYRLTSNLTVPDANTSAISGDGFDLDLNGFSIDGPVFCSGLPATCNASGTGIGVDGRNMTVRNGTVRGFGSHGVRVGPNSAVIRMRIIGNADSGVEGGFGPTVIRVLDSLIASNGGNGLMLAYGGARGMLVRNNTIEGNQLEGIRGTGGAFVDNVVTGNGGLGMNAAFGGQSTRFSGNTFLDNNGGNANPQVLGGTDLGGNLCGSPNTCP